jgi:hypothetical protein
MNKNKSLIKNKIMPYVDKQLLYSDKPESHALLYSKWSDEMKRIHIGTKSFELNSLNFRSDEFTNSHSGKHILFSGCSYTWGAGLFLEDVWSKILYDKISKEIDCSGYFNLGLSGTSMISQIVNMFKYFKNYGNPDFIFYNMPDPLRGYVYDKQTNMFYDGFYSKENLEIITLNNYQHYYMLDQYCKSNNIKLYSFSWSDSTVINPWNFDFIKTDLQKMFDSYYEIKTDDAISFVIDNERLNKNKKFLRFAMDNEHLGKLFHLYWANFIYNKYKKVLNGDLNVR